MPGRTALKPPLLLLRCCLLLMVVLTVDRSSAVITTNLYPRLYINSRCSTAFRTASVVSFTGCAAICSRGSALVIVCLHRVCCRLQLSLSLLVFPPSLLLIVLPSALEITSVLLFSFRVCRSTSHFITFIGFTQQSGEHIVFLCVFPLSSFSSFLSFFLSHTFCKAPHYHVLHLTDLKIDPMPSKVFIFFFGRFYLFVGAFGPYCQT